MTSTLRKACIIGWPVSHSRSPLIHGYWLKTYNIEGAYDRVPVRSDDVRPFLRNLAARGYAGCNVTVPHKRIAYELVDEVDPLAQRLKAVNTIWLAGHRMFGGNTDGYGFLANLDEQTPGWAKPDGHAVVLGAGGAARAVVAALAERNIKSIRVVNRTPANAEELLSELGISGEVVPWPERTAALDGAGLLVNTTTLGMASAPPLDIDLSPMQPGAAVCDIVYTPLETELLRQARARNLKAVDGLGMLLHQAVPGFKRWFGRTPEVTAELRDLVIADLNKE